MLSPLEMRRNRTVWCSIHRCDTWNGSLWMPTFARLNWNSWLCFVKQMSIKHPKSRAHWYLDRQFIPLKCRYVCFSIKLTYDIYLVCQLLNIHSDIVKCSNEYIHIHTKRNAGERARPSQGKRGTIRARANGNDRRTNVKYKTWNNKPWKYWRGTENVARKKQDQKKKEEDEEAAAAVARDK